MAFGKPKEPKPPKAPKEKKPKKPKKEKPPKAKKGKKGQPAPEAEGQELEQGQEQEQGKKKLPLPLLLIPLVVIAAAAVIVIFVILPRLQGDAEDDPDAIVSEEPEPEPPELPETIPIGEDVSIKGLTLGSDESAAQVVKSKRVTYTYTELVDAGKAAETYVSQLAGESPSFSLVDEDFVRLTEKPDYTTEEGMVLLARNVPVEAPAATPEPTAEATEPAEGEESSDPEESVEPTPEPDPTPEPEPTPEPVTYVHTVRISWSPGVCAVTVDEEEGRVTAAPAGASASHTVTQHGVKQILQGMDPAQLGLTGESMDEYEVMPMDGTEMVDGRPCILVYVFSDDNQANSNETMGSFLMSIDGEHLYKVDPVTNEIWELDYDPD